MFFRFINLLLFSTILLQAAPKAFDSLGNELEAFQKDCKAYQKASLIPKKIKKQCKVYISKVDTVFKVGYKLDPYIGSDNLSEAKLNKYLKLLLSADADRESIIKLIYTQMNKASKKNNTKYYRQLIQSKQLKLTRRDYDFMDSFKEVFSDNSRYLQHINNEIRSKEEAKNKEKQQKVRDDQKSLRYYKAGIKAYEKHRYRYAGKYFSDAAKLKHIQAAYKLWKMYELGDGAVKSPKQANVWHQKYIQNYHAQCNDGKYKVCVELGSMYSSGHNVAQNYTKAKDLYSKSCDNGYYIGCSKVGEMYYKGKGIKKDYHKADVLLKKACSGKDGNSCLILGKMYKEGYGVKQDIAESHHFYKKACDYGVQFGCGLATSLNYSEKAEIYKKHCAADKANMCLKLATMYDLGDEIKVDHDEAKRLYKKACDLGNTDGCSKLKTILAKEVVQEKQKVVRRQEKAEEKKMTERVQKRRVAARSSEYKHATILVSNVGSRANAYWNYEEASYTFSQQCHFYMNEKNYKGIYNKLEKTTFPVSSGYLDSKASEKAGSVRYEVYCLMIYKAGKISQVYRSTNRIVGKREIPKVMREECAFIPHDICTPAEPLVYSIFWQKIAEMIPR